VGFGGIGEGMGWEVGPWVVTAELKEFLVLIYQMLLTLVTNVLLSSSASVTKTVGDIHVFIQCPNSRDKSKSSLTIITNDSACL